MNGAAIEERTVRAAVYCRVSSDEQRERQTIDTQVEAARAYGELHPVRVVGIYRDDGVSGTVPLVGRPEGARLLRDAAAGAFSTVLVYKLDRLGRSSRLLLNTVAELEAMGVELRSMTEAFDTSSASGRFMLAMLSGAAGFERDNLIDRSTAGTNRLARLGAWLGGIVPFGYRAEGKGREARLVLSDEPIPGLGISEAGVVRTIFRLCAEEGQSTFVIARHLNALGVPPVYVRDDRVPRRGQRRQRTAGVWTPARVYNLLSSTTYRGLHVYGKRSRRERERIERPVPAIVDEETWRRAQEVLRRNRIMSPRNSKRQYLLRGLMKCGRCGLTYCGRACYQTGSGEKVYYYCNGKLEGRNIHKLGGTKCRSRIVPGTVEEAVWHDIEGFLRDPGAVLEELANEAMGGEAERAGLEDELRSLGRALASRAAERERVITLYRRGAIGDDDLDRQMELVREEEEELASHQRNLRERLEADGSAEAGLRQAEDLLRELNARLDGPLDFETKRALVETLVESIRVDTGEDGDATVRVTYRFTPTDSRRDRDSWRLRA